MLPSSSLTSRPPSRRWPLLLLLVAVFTILAAAGAVAQTPPASVEPQALQAPASTADFLATLSVAPAGGQDGLIPSPVFASGCTSNAQCPAGQICCLACGYADCDRRACFATKVCPHFP
jgi:hypothetical protein